MFNATYHRASHRKCGIHMHSAIAKKIDKIPKEGRIAHPRMPLNDRAEISAWCNLHEVARPSIHGSLHYSMRCMRTTKQKGC